MTYRLLVLVLLAGCGAPTRDAEVSDVRDHDHDARDVGGETDESVVNDDRVATTDRGTGDRPPWTCPETFGETGPTCTAGDAPAVCSYPEGDCTCRAPVSCGGAAPREMPLSWTCSVRSAPCPSAGTRCEGPARCSDDPCGWDGVSCVDGVWVAFTTPPPP